MAAHPGISSVAVPARAPDSRCSTAVAALILDPA